MKANEILKEDDRYSHYQELEDYQLAKAIATYKDIIAAYIKNGNGLYRGVESEATAILGDGRLLERKSTSTKNWFTLIMDNAPEWSEYPKRSKSYIASNDTSYAEAYGNLYVIIPLEDQPIGVCPDYDLWESFDNTLGELGDFRGVGHFTHIIDGLIRDIQNQTENRAIASLVPNDSSFKHMVSAFSAFDEALKDLPDLKIEEQKVLDMVRERGFVKTMEFAISPDKNGFEVVKGYQNVTKPTTDMGNEIWMSGKVLMLAPEVIADFKAGKYEN